MNEDQYEKDKIKRYYDEHLSLYEDLTKEVKFILEKNFKKENIKDVNIAKRVKTFERIEEKIKRKGYSNPIEQITDWAGVRVVCNFQDDIPVIKNTIKNSFFVHE